MLGVKGLYTTPQQLQGFSDGDAYSVDSVDVAEVVMGVDGVMSSGYVPQIKTMNIVLQADSASNTFFEAWYAAQEAAKETYAAFGVIRQPGVSRSYILTNGVLVGYSALSDGKKILQPRKFSIKWTSIVGAPI
jgi:hypothetical protein